MQNKLQELTEKIYQEGIAKGNEEAENIISKAKNEAKDIVEQAKKEADKIINDARKKSNEFKSNTESELKLSSKQALNSLKQQITDLINGKIVENSVASSYNDKSFIQEIIQTAVKNWTSANDNADIKILISKNKEKETLDFFKKSLKDILNKGVEVVGKDGIKNGFQISPKDGSYKVSFTEDDFINFFKDYLRPKLVELLFGDE